MIKIAIASAAVLAAAAPAMAGPYVNIEANSGFVGSDYQGTVIDNHVGYEGPLGEKANYYVQAGPAVVAAEGSSTEVELSGKAGVNVAVAENLSAYGEVSFLTADGDNGYATKAGLKYSF